MLMDKENHEIKICKTPNPHILILGKSGEGKTYFCCRKIEEEIQDGKSVLIFDYSTDLCRLYCAFFNLENCFQRTGQKYY